MIDHLAGGNADTKAGFGSINPNGQLATSKDIPSVVVDLFTGKPDLPNGEALLVDSGSMTSQIQSMRYDKK